MTRFEFLEDSATEKTVPSKEWKGSPFKIYGKDPFTEEEYKNLRQNVGYGLKKLSGGMLGSLGDILQFVKQTGLGGPVGNNIPQILPTSETIEKGFEKLSGEQYQPTGAIGEYAGEAAGFLGSILGLGGPLKKSGKIPGMARTALAAIIPSSFLTTAKKMDLPEWAQVAGTVGAGFLTHRLTGKSLRTIESDLYKRAESLSQGESLYSDELLKRLENLQERLAEGLKTGPKSRINSMLEEIAAKAGGGAIKVHDLMQFRRDINEVSKEFTKDQLKGSERYWRPLRNAIDQTIGDFEKTNPEFSEAYRNANSLHRGLNESRAIENFIRNNKTLAGLGGAADAFLFYLGHGIDPISGAATAKIAEFSVALARNKGLRNAWWNIIKDASKNEIKGTATSLKKFNNELEKEGLLDSKNRYEILD